MSKDVNLNDATEVANLKNKLWASFGILRRALDPEEFSVVLYLLSLFNEGGDIKITIAKSEKAVLNVPTYDLASLRKEPASDRLNHLYSFHGYFLPALQQIPVKILNQIGEVFNSFDLRILKEHFAEIFDYVLYEISSIKGKMGGESIQPSELTKFVCELADLPEYSQVYNPFAGLASFGVMFPKKIAYLAQEINYSTWVIGSLRLLAYNLEGNAQFLNESTLQQDGGFISEDLRSHSKFDLNRLGHDLIVANPPMAMRLSETIEGRFGNIKTAEHFLIEKGIEDLKPNGKLIAILGLSFASRRGTEEALRKFIIDNDLVEMVIALPAGLQAHTKVATFILVINKEKVDKGYVRFVEGRSFVNRVHDQMKLDIDGLLEVIKIGDSDKFIRLMANDTIAFMDYNLDVHRYFMKSIEGYQLGELLTPIRGQRISGVKGKSIQVKDLKVDKFNFKMEHFDIEREDTISEEFEITESCLLVAAVGRKLKPTFFQYSGTTAYHGSNILSFKIDTNKVDIEYLITELYSDLSIEQLDNFQIGTGIPRLRKVDFLSLRIPLPSISEQLAKVKGLKQEYIKSREKELFLEKEILGLKDEAFREFASIKHTFRQYLNALKTNVSGTRKFMAKKENNIISLHSIYSEKLNETFGDHLISLENTIDSMSKLLSTPAENQFVGEAPIEMEMDLSALVLNAQNRFKNPEIFQFEKLFVDWESLASTDGGYISTSINIIADDFYRIFSNIISNAVDHGFKNRTGNYFIRTSLSFDSEVNKLVLEVSNNGRPIPAEFTFKHLTTRGEKTTDSLGSGIGVADVKSLLQKYDATLDIKNDEQDEFPVTYILQFDLAISVF